MENVVALLFTLYAIALVVVYVAWTRRRTSDHTGQGDCPHTNETGTGPCSICGIFGR